MQRERIWRIKPLERRTERNRILPLTSPDDSTLSMTSPEAVLIPDLHSLALLMPRL